MNSTINTTLKNELEQLAKEAFQKHLISGYGDSEFPNQYQIVYQGKPRHFPLGHAFLFLKMLIDLSSTSSVAPNSSPGDC